MSAPSPPPPLDIRPAPGTADADEPKKRAAFAGQWRTPPLPVFPTTTSALSEYGGDSQVSSGAAADSSEVTLNQLAPPPPNIPLSTEDYQKALQEAYRRGAEAATARALAQGSTASPAFLPSTASGPDLQQQQKCAELELDETMQIRPPSPLQSQPPMDVAPAPPTIAPSSATFDPTMPPPPMMPTATNSSRAARTHHLPPLGPPPPPPMMFQPSHQQRSMSLPDMTSYGAKQEEEKRQKRLARNRASARLRRLRKKNLVDAYETEVGILEKTLEQLKVHEWGTQDNPRALVEALSMDRGQQVLTTEERKQTATDILDQQLDYVGMLEEMMQEQYALQQIQHDPALGQELRAVLGLTDDQVQQLANAATGWQGEWDALQTVKASLQAMRDNNWLWNEGCTAVAEEFMSLLHKNQISKLLLWADHNVEAIDELDIVNAPSQIAQGPVFHFGVNSNPEGLLDEERTQGD